VIYERISENRNKSLALAFFFVLFVCLLGWLFGQISGFGYFGVALAAAIALPICLAEYYWGDRVALSIARATPATKREYPHLVNSVEGLAIAAGIPAPKVYIIDDTAINAFATGRDPQHASIAVTKGAVQKLKRAELEGVIGHEMAHIGNRDTRFMVLVVVMVAITALVSDMIIRSQFWHGRHGDNKGSAAIVVAAVALAALSPIIAQLVKFAISRRREFLADAEGARLTRYPDGLAAALQKIAADKEPLEVANKATAHMYIANPLKDYSGALDGLFSTHPPIQERIKALRAM